MIPLICIVGPTASGKTALTVELAKKYGTEVISADSMQIYKRMNIGTAKPTFEEMQGIVHHLIDVVEPWESFSVANYCGLAHDHIKDISAKGKISIMAGGTGLYINSVVNNIDFSDGGSDEDYRSSLWKIAEENGNEFLHNELEKIDPLSAKRIHSNDVRRVIRALEVFKVTGKTMTQHQADAAAKPKPYNTVKVGLLWGRAELYDRINRRVDIMLEQGLVAEVESLLDERFLSSTAAQGIGYKEIIAYLQGRSTFDEAVSDIKQGSRNYAKRQMTFFNADKSINWIDSTGRDLPYIIEKTEKLFGGIIL